MLRSLCVLDTPSEERFDAVTRLAQQLFQVPLAAVTFVDEDRVWIKSCQGVNLSQVERGISFGAHAILGDHPMVVPDATADLRFYDNPLVVSEPNVRFYAAYPLKASNGERVGTLSIADRRPRRFSSADEATLATLGGIVERELQAGTSEDLVTGLLTRRGFMLAGKYCADWCRSLDRSWAIRLLWATNTEVRDRANSLPAADARAIASALRAALGPRDVVARLSENLFGVVQVGAFEEEGASFGSALALGGRVEVDNRAAITIDESCVVFDSASSRSFDEQLIDSWIELHLEIRRRAVEDRMVATDAEMLLLAAFTAIYRSLPLVAPRLRRRGSLFECGYGTICCVNANDRLSQIRLHPAVLESFCNDRAKRSQLLKRIAAGIERALDAELEYYDLRSVKGADLPPS